MWVGYKKNPSWNKSKTKYTATEWTQCGTNNIDDYQLWPQYQKLHASFLSVTPALNAIVA